MQLEPGNEQVRRKLDEMIDLVFQGANRGADAPPLVINPTQTSLPAPEESRPALPLQQFLRKMQPVHLVLGCTGLAIIIMLAFSLRILNQTGPNGKPNHRLSYNSTDPFLTQTPTNASGSNSN